MARYVTGQEVGTGCFRMMYMILDDSAVSTPYSYEIC